MKCSNPTVPGNAVYGGTQDQDSSSTDCNDWFSSCRNPLWALDHPDDCGLVTVSSVSIQPNNQSVSVGRSAAIRVIAQFSDGRLADVTGESVVGSSNKSVRHLGGGILSGDEVGTSYLTATWKGRLATGSVSVFDNACAESSEWDVVVVADDGSVQLISRRAMVPNGPSGGMWAEALRRTRSTVDYSPTIYSFVLSLDLLDDGRFIPGVGWDSHAQNPIGIGGATRSGRDRIWTGSEWSDHTCPFPNVNTGDTGDIGGRIMKAFEIFQNGRPAAKKLLVLFSTGGETSCNPGMRAACAALSSQGIEIAVITPLTSSDLVYGSCDYPMTAHSVLSQCASRECLFFDGESGGAGAGYGIASSLLRISCENCIGSSGGGVGVWHV